jgi:outer membrane protein TolC
LILFLKQLTQIGSILLGFLIFGPAIAQSSEQLENLLLAADGNPSLRSALEEIHIAESKAVQAGSLSDPVMSWSVLNYPVEDESGNSHRVFYEVRISQMYPYWGKLDTRQKSAAKRSQWFASAFADARLQMRSYVKDAWYRLLFLQQAIDLTKRNLQILDDFIRLTETRYEVGKGLQQNVLKAHLQRSKQLDKLLDLEQQLETTIAELNSLAGRASGQQLATAAKLHELSSVFNLEELQRQAHAKRPMYSAYQALIEEVEAKRNLAKLDYRPDFTLYAAYRLSTDDDDAVVAGVSFNLPVRRERRAAAVAEADSLLRQVIQKRNDFNLQVDLSIHQSLARYQQAGKLAKLYQTGIIPQANQTFQATLSAYQVDKVDFLDLLDSLMTLYQYEIDYIKALSDQHRSLAELEAAAGLDIDKLPERPASVEG